MRGTWRYTGAINLAAAQCCARIGERTRYVSRGKARVLCGHCLEAVLRSENPDRPDGDELSRLASYYTP